MIVSFRKCWLLLIVEIALTSCGGNSNDPRQNFTKSVVKALVANNWDRSALIAFLCDDRPKDSVEKGIAFDLYQDYGGIKSVGRIKLIPVASPPAMAMDTFVPVLFNRQFAPFPAMPEHIAYHATYLQLQTQKTAEGKPCLEGWGRNEIPVNPDQTQDFLSYKGIFNHD
jgi:hypothetical protein